MSHDKLTKHHHHDYLAHPAHECDGEGHVHHHHADGSCCCHEHEQEFHGVHRTMLVRLIISALIYAAALLIPMSEILSKILMVLSALISGYDTIYNAFKNLISGRFFDEYFLMTFAACAACAIGEFEEAAAVFLLYRIGEACQSYAIRHSRKKLSLVFSDHMHHGESTDTEKLLTRFARIYTPVIIVLAVLIAVLLPLLGVMDISGSVYRSLSFLVLACPCAIVISVPMTYSAGIAAAMGKHIFFRDSTAIDNFSKASPAREQMTEAVINQKDSLLYSTATIDHIEEAEVVIIGSEEGSLERAIRSAKHTKRIVLENVYFTIIVKLAVLLLAALGRSQLWFSVFADSGVTVLVVLNSLRALYIK